MPGIHASELSGCQRKVVYSLNDTKRVRKINRRWRRVFEMGHAIHRLVQENFHKWARATGHMIQFIDEVPIKPSLQKLATLWEVHSACDGIFSLRDPETNYEIMRVLIEIKSISKAQFDALKGPKPEHIEQAHLYMACLDVPFVWFIYWCKDNQNWTDSRHPDYLIPFNPEIWHVLEQRMAAAHQHKALGTLPDREEGTACDFCAFKETCRPDYLYKPKHGNPPKLHASLGGRK